MSWNQLQGLVDTLACGLETIGVGPQDMINIFSANRPEILITDFACYRNRAIPVSIYATSSAEQVEFIIKDSGAVMIMVGNREQYETVRSVAPRCHTLKTIVVYDESIEIPDDDKLMMRFSSML